MERIVKIVVLAALLVAASCLMGTVCWRVQEEHEVVLAPSLEMGGLLLWCLGGMGAVALASGLVAALVRPLWMSAVVFLFASLGLLLGWEVRLGTGVLALLYFLALLLYAAGTARELEERVRFSVRGVSDGLPLLLTVLALAACGGIYFGYAARIEAEGFAIPSTLQDTFVELVMQRVSTQMEVQEELAVEQREQQLAEIREQMEAMWLQPVESGLERYEKYVPALLALGLFWTLRTLAGVLAWVPVMVLRGLFPLLTSLGVTRVTKESREVERLVME